MRLKLLLILSVSVLTMFLVSVDVKADSINIFNTGVDGSNVVISAGAIDPHYTIISAPNPYGPSAYGEYLAGSWIANTSTSHWIAPSNSGFNYPTGNYTYRTTFDLSGLDISTATLSGRWATDNEGIDIMINGTSSGNTIPYSTGSLYSFQAFHTFSINTGFVNGINTLDFIVHQDGNSPTGLRVELTGTTDAAGTSVPEPSTMMMLGSGLVGLVGFGRKRFKK